MRFSPILALFLFGCHAAPPEEIVQLSPGTVEFKREGANLRMRFALHNASKVPIDKVEVNHIKVGKVRAPDVLVGTVAPGQTVHPELTLKNVPPGRYNVYYSYYYPDFPEGFKGKRPLGQVSEFQHDDYDVP